MSIDVYVEVGSKRAFAGAIDWPGWCRSAKTEEAALESLAAYAARYGKVVARSRLGFTAPSGSGEFVVRERLTGNATTDFGAPGIAPAADRKEVSEPELDRLLRILEA